MFINEQNEQLKPIQFFKGCQDDLKEIIRQQRIKHNSKMIPVKDKSQNSFENTIHQQQKLLINIIIDMLRSKNLNYTYSVLMRESKITSEQIVSKKMLAEILGVQKQINNSQQLNYTIIQALIEQRQKSRNINYQYNQYAVQVDLHTHSKKQIHNDVVLQNRIKEVREEVEQREKKYYEQKLEHWKSVEIMELREEILKDLNKKFDKDKFNLSQKYNQLKENLKNDQNSSHQTQELSKYIEKNKLLESEVKQLRNQNKQFLSQKLSHRCTDSQQYKQLKENERNQRKDLESKKKQYQLAIRNLTTKIDDIVIQKKKIEGNQKLETQQFMKKVTTHKNNKQYMVESLYAEMKNISRRNQVISQENKGLKNTITTLKKQLQQMLENKKEIIQNKQCMKCKQRQLFEKFRGQLKNVMVQANNEDFVIPVQQKEGQQSQSSFDQTEPMIQNQNRIVELQSDMRIAKNKIRMMMHEYY